MSSNYDASEFIDGDFQRQKIAAANAVTGVPAPGRAPTREEVDSKVAEAHQKLVELKRAQEELERERALLEETRRRQAEFQAGRQEMIQNLTRGLGLLEETEFAARRDAEQMSKTISELRDALNKVQAIHEEMWTKDSFNVQLTQALTTLENARMEWNSARLKFGVLSGESAGTGASEPAVSRQGLPVISELGMSELCRLGLAFTWPVAVAILAVGTVLVALLLRQ